MGTWVPGGRRVCLGVAAALFVSLVPAAHAGTVAFSSHRCPGDAEPRCSNGVWLVEDDGSGLRKLSVPEHPGLWAADSPSWSPDGREVAHMRYGSAGMGIWVTAKDGSSTRELVSLAGSGLWDIEEPVWSPDGLYIAFTGAPKPPATGEFFQHSIYVVPATGGPVRRLTANFYDSSPVFTPDSRRVAFKRSGPPKDPRYVSSPVGIMSTGVEVGQEAKLFEGGPLGSPEENSFALATAKIGFAPDARSIAVASSGRIYLASPEGLETRELRSGTGNGNITLAWAWETRPRLVVASGTYTAAPESISIFDVDDPGAPPVALTRNPPGGPAGDAHPDWTSTLGQGAIPDLHPPVVELDLGTGQAGRARVSRKARRPTRVSRRSLDLLAADASGIRRIESIFGREQVRKVRVGRRCANGRCRAVVRRRTVCRFATGRRLSRPRSCRRPITVRHAGRAGWKRTVGRLPKGRYRMRVRVRDVYGRAGGRRMRRIVLTG